MTSFFGELRRRNVVKVAVAYAIVGWLLIQVSTTVLPVFEAPAWIAKVVTFLILLGFPVALILSWAYELTPDGVQRTASVPASESLAKGSGKTLEFIVIGALVLALLFVVYSYETGSSEPTAVVARDPAPVVEPAAANATAPGGAGDVLPNSVAVLLCDNLSPSADDAYFAASIHEEILNQLVKISSLNVIARTSVLPYAAAPRPISQIAAELRVGAVMECSVRFAGTAIMVTAQLIDPNTNVHLWSETYPGDLSDLSAVFAMQADIAMNIANTLEAEFSSAEQARLGKQATVSAEAYTLYLKTNGATLGADVIPLLDAAIALDPEFALAYASKARAIAAQMRFGVDRTAARQQLTIESAEKALSIDPDLAATQLALAAVHELNWRRVDAENAYERAFQLYPNDPVVALDYAAFRRDVGEYLQAIRLGQIAVRLDPNRSNSWHQLAVTYLFAKDFDAAATALQNSLALNPDGPASTVELGRLYLARGNLTGAGEAFRAVDRTHILDSVLVPQAWLALNFERAGLQQDAERAFARVEKLVPADSTGSVGLATAYIAIHDYDRAYAELAKAIDGPDPLDINAAIELKVNRWEHPALEEPRFVALRNRLGFQD